MSVACYGLKEKTKVQFEHIYLVNMVFLSLTNPFQDVIKLHSYCFKCIRIQSVQCLKFATRILKMGKCLF